MIRALRRLSPVRADLVAHHRDLAPLRKAAKSQNWPAISAWFDQFPARADRSLAVRLVAETSGVERLLQRTVDAERDSSLARTLLGARLIVLAWKARGRYLAQHVSQAQWKIFGEHLQHAERVLADATAIDPTSAAAWTERITTARGLSLSAAEGRHRYDRVAENCDAPYLAQAQLLQNLCPKWQGSVKEMHAFAAECLRVAAPGSLAGAIVANAHAEHAFTFDYMYEIPDYLSQRRVINELEAAAAHTVRHPDFQSCHGDVAAHTVFAFAFFVGGAHRQAAAHFAALGRRSAGYPWPMFSGRKWKDATRAARSEVARNTVGLT